MSRGGGGSRVGLMDDTTLANLDEAWQEREKEAKALAASFPAASLALRFYALEIRIKTIICKRLGIDLLPRHCKTHELDELIIFTGLLGTLADPANDGIRQNWDILAKFARERLNQIRYLPGSTLKAADLDEQLNALDNPGDGVWTWLSRLP
jgi:hypothetical protein